MSEDFAAYKRWLRYIHENHPELPKGISRTTLLAFCQSLARAGSSGVGCFKSNAKIAGELEIKRETLKHYREFAVEIGWFVPTGTRRGRVAGLDISIPADVTPKGIKSADSDVITKVTSPPETEHNRATSPALCPACQPLAQKVRNGEMTMDQLQAIHSGD